MPTVPPKRAARRHVKQWKAWAMFSKAGKLLHIERDRWRVVPPEILEPVIVIRAPKGSFAPKTLSGSVMKGRKT